MVKASHCNHYHCWDGTYERQDYFMSLQITTYIFSHLWDQCCKTNYLKVVTLFSFTAFKCINEIALAKAEIFGGLDLNGVAIIPRDNEYFKTLMTECRDRYKVGKVLTFGRHRDSDVKLTESR